MTSPVAGWFDPASARLGLVLRGSYEGDIQNSDQSACMSQVNGLRLTIDYTVQ